MLLLLRDLRVVVLPLSRRLWHELRPRRKILPGLFLVNFLGRTGDEERLVRQYHGPNMRGLITLVGQGFHPLQRVCPVSPFREVDTKTYVAQHHLRWTPRPPSCSLRVQ